MKGYGLHLLDNKKVTMPPYLTTTILFLSTKRTMKFALVFCIGAIIGVLGIQFASVHVDVQMLTTEKGSLQFFVDTGGGFNESQSRVIPLAEPHGFSHYRASIRANGLITIRVDPIETQGKFEILGLKIDYLFWHRQWYGYDELKYLLPANDIEVISTEGAILSAKSLGSDPSFITKDMEYFKHWQLIATIIAGIFGGVVAILFFVVIRYFGGVNVVFVNGHIALIIIVIAGALLRIFYWFGSALPSEPSQMGSVHPDEGTYFSIAQYIMTHGLGDYLFSEQSVMVAPANPVYLALMYTAFNSINVIRAINLLLSILTILLIYKLGKRIFSKPVGLFAAGICAVHSQLIGYSATLLTEPLFLTLLIAGIYYLILTLETQNLSRYRYQIYALATSFFLIMAMLTRSIAMLLPIFLLAAIWTLEAYRSWRIGSSSYLLLKRAALPLILPIFIVGIVLTKNYVIFDRFMISTGSGAVLWLGSRADTEGDDPPYRGLTYDTQVVTHGASHLSIQGDMLLIDAAKKKIRENPLGYAWWNVKKVGRLVVGNNLAWLYPNKNIADWYRASGRNAVATTNKIFQIALAATIVVYGIIGLVLYRRQVPFNLIIAASVCYLIIFSIPFMTIQRFGLPLVLLLVIPASAVMYGAWQADTSLRRIALFGGVPFVLAILLQVLFLG